jgi:lysyl-tRNA synthetase class 2
MTLTPASRTAPSLPGVSSLARTGRDHVPLLAALATALVGAINLASVLTAELPVRLRDLMAYAPAQEMRLAHALALPAGLALIGAAWQLGRRRRGALQAAVALLAALGVLDVARGLDMEEALISWALAGVLWRARGAFWVRHDPDRLGSALRRAGTALAATAAAGMGAVALAAPHARSPLPLHRVPDVALGLLTLTAQGPGFAEPFGWLRLGLGMLGIAAVAGAAAVVLQPLRPSRLSTALDRRRAAALVRRHGTDTLSAFKLRGDLLRRWSPDGRAMAAYRVQSGTLLLAGDPVGPADAIPGLMADLVAYARAHGLALGAVGASSSFADVAAGAGLRRLYLGDEALLDTGVMPLDGKDRKTLRKAVRRVARNGFTAELRTAGSLDPGTLGDLEAVSDCWRDGAPERGFSMAHDALVDELLPDALVVLARDEEGALRGFLHFVPVFGRATVSLGFMRRDRQTPNGLTEFMVVEAARLLGEAGIEEFSLNFSAYGRWLREPANRLERLLARVLRVGDRWFQVERLLRFNQRFQPRWQPRHLLYERPSQLPRIALAAMQAEGQLPTPRAPAPVRRLAARRDPATA